MRGCNAPAGASPNSRGGPMPPGVWPHARRGRRSRAHRARGAPGIAPAVPDPRGTTRPRRGPWPSWERVNTRRSPESRGGERDPVAGSGSRPWTRYCRSARRGVPGPRRASYTPRTSHGAGRGRRHRSGPAHRMGAPVSGGSP